MTPSHTPGSGEIAERIRKAWLAKRKETEARFWSKVNRCGEDECWEWLGPLRGSQAKHSRGTFTVDGMSMIAPRFSYAIHNDFKSMHGMFVMHACDNPKCVNPRHLSVGTHEDNMADMIAKGRGAWQQDPEHAARITSKGHKILEKHPELRPHGERHFAAKLSFEDALSIRQSKEKTRVLANRYGVSMSAVQRVRNGTQWRLALLAAIEETSVTVDEKPVAWEFDPKDGYVFFRPDPLTRYVVAELQSSDDKYGHLIVDAVNEKLDREIGNAFPEPVQDRQLVEVLAELEKAGTELLSATDAYNEKHGTFLCGGALLRLARAVGNARLALSAAEPAIRGEPKP